MSVALSIFLCKESPVQAFRYWLSQQPAHVIDYYEQLASHAKKKEFRENWGKCPDFEKMIEEKIHEDINENPTV